MFYKILAKENSVISCVFDEPIDIKPEMYSIINRNSSLMIPGMRDLSDPTAINYDVLGSVSMDEEIRNTVFDKNTLYSFIEGILNVIEQIEKLNIDEKQVVTDESNIYLSMYDKSPRFICLPVDKDTLGSGIGYAGMLKNISLKVKSNGAYELIGFVVEKTSTQGFSVADFKKDFEAMFGGKTAVAAEPEKSHVPVETPIAEKKEVEPSPMFHENEKPKEEVYAGREYIPFGVPLSYDEDNDAEAQDDGKNDRTQILFSSSVDAGMMPFISPVDDNSESARKYIAGAVLRIGRSSENDLCINVNTVSGKHAEIRRGEGGCTITDLHSTNKTYVNGRAIAPDVPVALRDQDLIAFNKVRYRYFEH